MSFTDNNRSIALRPQQFRRRNAQRPRNPNKGFPLRVTFTDFVTRNRYAGHADHFGKFPLRQTFRRPQFLQPGQYAAPFLFNFC